jgi:hypothetical protein
MKLITGNRQRIDTVFDLIALTALKPDHPEAMHLCCHRKTAWVIEKHADQLLDTDEVVLVGMGDLVCHSFIIRDSEVIYDSDTNGIYNHERGTYNAENWENSHFKEDIYVLATKQIGAMKLEVMAKLMRYDLTKTTMAQSPCNSANTRRPFARYVP